MRESSSCGKGKKLTYLRHGAQMIHIWLLENACNHGKLLEHTKSLKIFTSTLMRESHLISTALNAYETA